MIKIRSTFHHDSGAGDWDILMPIERHNLVYDLKEAAEKHGIATEITIRSSAAEVMALADQLDAIDEARKGPAFVSGEPTTESSGQGSGKTWQAVMLPKSLLVLPDSFLDDHEA